MSRIIVWGIQCGYNHGNVIGSERERKKNVDQKRQTISAGCWTLD